jgi:ABC-2 type transport system ATP-binding protein
MTGRQQERSSSVVVASLSKQFAGVTALDDVSFSVQSGELVGVVGPDGAGKTTLFNLISGILNPSQGSIQIAGGSRRARVGYVTQRSSLIDELDCVENIMYSAMLQGVDRRIAEERATNLLKSVGLLAFKTRAAGKLSGGMKQKLALCCALAGEPDVLLLDEPSTGLDPIARRELWWQFGAISDSGVPIIVATPDFDEGELCKRVVFLQTGKVLRIASPQNLREGVAAKRSVIRGARLEVVDEFLNSLWNSQSPIIDVLRLGDSIEVLINQATDDQWLAMQLQSAGFQDCQLEHAQPTLENAYCILSENQGAPPVPEVKAEKHVLGSRDAIRIANVSKRFGDFTAVNNLSLQVHEGEIFGLLGANGAGKTTTIRLLCGLLSPSAGELSVLGFTPDARNKGMRSMIGYVNQQFSLYDELSVEENVAYTARTFSLPKAALREGISSAVLALGLMDVRSLPVKVLSRGMKQRVALAAALSHRPRLLLLDEPTAGTNPEARRRIWRLIRLLSDQGVTVIVTTHHFEEAEFCNRIGLIVSGNLIACDSPLNLKTNTPGSVIEVRGRNFDAVLKIALEVVPAGNIARVNDVLRIICPDDASDNEVRARLSGRQDCTFVAAGKSLEEAFILRAQRAMEAVAV